MRSTKTRRIVAATLGCFCLTALGGCSGDIPTSPDGARFVPSSSPASARRSASVPISGRCALTVLATDPFPAPPVFRQVATGTCRLSHLGRATVHFVQVVDFGTRTQHSLELTYTAANGDVLRASSSGTSAPTAGGVTFAATITFLGGTGRFANASGQAHADGAANLATGTSQYTLAGSIIYGSAGHPD